MNLLTDLIQDVAKEMKVELTEEEKRGIQKSIFGAIMQEISWIQRSKVVREDFPWIEKEKVS